jgi:hypothetical protein
MADVPLPRPELTPVRGPTDEADEAPTAGRQATETGQRRGLTTRTGQRLGR